MRRAPCCDKASVKKGPWSSEEDVKLTAFIEKYGTGGNWISLPKKAGLKRCGKSCRLRWLNYLRPNIKHGKFSDEEDRIICTLFSNIGSRWSIIAAQLPGRTDNGIKNYWNTKLKKKLALAAFVSSSQRNSSRFVCAADPPFSSDWSSNHYQCELPPVSIRPSFSNSSCLATETSLFKTQENLHHFINYYSPTLNESFQVFGSSEGSCSSSDVHFTQMINSSSKMGHDSNPQSNRSEETRSVDYDLDYLNQLISSDDNNGLNSCLNVDENKRGENLAYYYE